MSFLDIRFPTDIALGSSGGPEYFTDILSTAAGYEQRNINWHYPRMRYNIASGIKTAEQWQELLAFFRNCRGKAMGFRFKDWNDYNAVGEELTNIRSDEKYKFYQLSKTYRIAWEDSSIIAQRMITKPVFNTVVIYNDGQKLEDVTDINCFTGIIKLDKEVSGPITADFEFDVPVRFDIDYLSSSVESRNLHLCDDIPLIEIKGR